MEEARSQSRAGVRKLKANPLKVEVFLEYEPHKEKDKIEFKPKAGESVEAWMHPLTYDEWADCDAVAVEGFRRFRGMGGNEDDSHYRGVSQRERQLLFYVLRVSDKEKAERLFQDPMEACLLNASEVERLLALYNETFVPTREERKNSLRERLGLTSETSSASPVNSETPSSPKV